MKTLTEHYRLLLGLDSAWKVGNVSLSLEDKKVEIELEHLGGRMACPDCRQQWPIADHAPSRTWRHLDTMQFETILRAQVPRVHCPEHGVKTATVPWADKHSRFTWFFEAFVVQIIQATSSLSAASRLLRLDWDALQRVMERAVERGMERREEREIPYLGVDEKNFGKGQDYVSILTDIAGSRILEVVEDRTQAAAESLFETLSEEQRDNVEAVAMDMSQAYRNAAEKCVPQAAIVHDKFHLAKHLNEAVDQVRRQEHKTLRAEGDERLTGSRQLWLFRPENIEPDLRLVFDDLRAEELKTSRAWALKEQFRWFWEYTYAGNAKKFFDRWYAWASRCRLKPIVKVAAMFKRHLPRLLTYFKHPITNATSEGFNSRVQAIKAQARGFRDFANYRVRILFHCGRLDLLPTIATH